MFSSRLVQNIIVIVAVVALILAAVFAYRSGTNGGKTRAIIAAVPAIQKGLGYFYQDQNRYPTTQEFLDRNLMMNYFTPFPPSQITGGSCSQSFAYRSSDLNKYSVYFCLPSAGGSFKGGWNQIDK